MKTNNYTSVPKMWNAFETRSLIYVLVFMFVMCAFVHASAQTTNTQTIRGMVKSGENNEPVPGTNIFLKGANTVGILADSEGQFEFPRPLKPGDVIVFSFIGLKTMEYVVPEQATGLIAIIMPRDYIQMVDEVLTEREAPVQVALTTKSSRRINR